MGKKNRCDISRDNVYNTTRKYCKLAKSVLKEIKNIPRPENYSVGEVKNITESSEVGGLLRHRTKYNIVETWNSNDPTCKRYLYDKTRMIDNSQNLRTYIRRMTEAERKRHLTDISHQFKEHQNMDFVVRVNPFEHKKIFRSLNDQGFSCKDLVNLWVQDGYQKDPIILEITKSLIIPLKPRIDRKTLQNWNNHTFMITQRNTAKSASMRTVNNPLYEGELTDAKLFGSYMGQHYTRLRMGVLHGHGGFAWDEPNTADNPEVMNRFGDVMSNGRRTRGTQGDIDCLSTRTVIILGNPKDSTTVLTDETMPVCVEAFLMPLLKEVNSTALGRRFGIQCFNINVVPVSQYDPVPALKNFSSMLGEFFYSGIDKVYDNIFRIMLKYQRWLDYKDRDYINTVKNIVKEVTYPKTRGFMTGLTDNPQKHRMAALKILLLENLDAFMLEKRPVTTICRLIDEGVEDKIRFLQGINISSIKACSNPTDIDKRTPEFAEKVIEFMGDSGSRKIAKATGYSHTHIAKIRRRMNKNGIRQENDKKDSGSSE